jgi:hypothetical protein
MARWGIGFVPSVLELPLMNAWETPKAVAVILLAALAIAASARLAPQPEMVVKVVVDRSAGR